ncbi:MAG TPA: hypothetical protein VI893_03485, partial [Thermoplasmata archaeon]|nr:hypothetical protein [Thermoplasmata archaeon]
MRGDRSAFRTVAALLLVFSFSQPGTAASSMESTDPPAGMAALQDTLRIAHQNGIKGLNPFAVSDVWSERVVDEIYDRTANTDWRSGTTQPWIAVEWCYGSRAAPLPGRCSADESDDDPLNATVRYRLGAWAGKWGAGPKFHDGSEVTTEDVLFSYAALVYDPRSPSPVRELMWRA